MGSITFLLFIQGLHIWRIRENEMFAEPFGAGAGAARVTSEGN